MEQTGKATPDRLLSTAEVITMLGIGRTTLYYMQKRGEFVPHVAISRNRIGFPEARVREWLRSRDTAHAA